MNNRANRILKRNYYFTDDSAVTVTASPVHVVKTGEPVRENKWAVRRREIRQACGSLSDEEISMYACLAAGSWESR